jgi:hypothetical protein
MNIHLTLKQAIIRLANRIKRAPDDEGEIRSLTSFIDSPSANSNSPSLLFFNIQNAFPNSGNENVIQFKLIVVHFNI